MVIKCRSSQNRTGRWRWGCRCSTGGGRGAKREVGGVGEEGGGRSEVEPVWCSSCTGPNYVGWLGYALQGDKLTMQTTSM